MSYVALTRNVVMSHRELLRGKEETLLRIIHPNVLLLALLTEQDLLDECTEQALAAERTNFDRNRRLLEWLKHSPRETFEGFLRALRTNGQEHVANYVDGTLGRDSCQLTDSVLRKFVCAICKKIVGWSSMGFCLSTVCAVSQNH